MVFSSSFSKFGKGENLNAIMDSPSTISIFYFKDGIQKKVVTILNNSLSLEKVKVSLGFSEVIPLDGKTLITRIDKSLGVKHD